MENETTFQVLPATENPDAAKAMMIHAMCSNDVLGLPIAAMQRMIDPTKWADGAQLYDLSFMTHQKWIQEDEEYAKTILLIEKAGFKAQKAGHWAMGMGLAAEDASVWKAMLNEFNRLENESKKPENEQKSPFEGIDNDVLIALLNHAQHAQMKIVV